MATPFDRVNEAYWKLKESVPDDIREAGWVVAVHNDYRINGEPYTFWLFTKPLTSTDNVSSALPEILRTSEGTFVKGEGKTDKEALNEVRRKLGLKSAN